MAQVRGPAHPAGTRLATLTLRAPVLTLRRDWRDNVNGLDLDEWGAVCTDRRYFNQTNMPLYADSCFWCRAPTPLI